MNYLTGKVKAVLGILFLLGLAFASLAIYRAGYSNAELVKQAEIDTLVIDHTTALAKAQQNLIKQEREAALRISAIDSIHQQELQHVKAERDRVIDDLRTGTARLRDRFTCPSTAATAGQPSTGTSSRDAAKGVGLSQEDARFLIRIASEADEVVKQLQACQAIVRSDRGQQ